VSPRVLLAACLATTGCLDARRMPPGERTPDAGPAETTACHRPGEARPCSRANEHGRCQGEEVCTGVAWGACDAPEPAPEACNGLDDDCNGAVDDVLPAPCRLSGEGGACDGIEVCEPDTGPRCVAPPPGPEACNGLDDDCDGETDEDFTDQAGRYVDVRHCGACQHDCEGRVAFSAEVECDAGRDPPGCRVVRCQDGFAPLGDDRCVPLEDALCAPCLADEECLALSPGSLCLEAEPGSARFCGRDCAADGVFGERCPTGFSCTDEPRAGGRPRRCRPPAGGCGCEGVEDGSWVPCREVDPRDPDRSCLGRSLCEGGAGGPCELPEDVCDGRDNDCNGVADDAYVDPGTGRYSVDSRHCGRCNRDCGVLEIAHGRVVCDAGADPPACAPRCDDGWADVSGGLDDGCECPILSEHDTPDGVDRNCDGVDGDAGDAVFVSSLGRPGAAGTREDPLASVGEAVDLATATGRGQVYVAGGVYDEDVELAGGVSLYGGFTSDFRRRDAAAWQTALVGVGSGDVAAATLTARSIRRATRVDGFVLVGASTAAPGRSTYAVLLVDSDGSLSLTGNELHAGDAGPGTPGAAGGGGRDGGGGGWGAAARDSGGRECGLVPLQGPGRGGALGCDGEDVSGGDGGLARCPRTQRLDGREPCAVGAGDCRNSCTLPPCDPLPPPQGVGEPGRGPAPGAPGAPTYDRWTDAGICGACRMFQALGPAGQRLPGVGPPRQGRRRRGGRRRPRADRLGRPDRGAAAGRLIPEGPYSSSGLIEGRQT